ncbi:MAG: tadA [Gammaproteobacteria bacterium]|jgi:tRNA(adenine34) deaminase|nr:tadA [Gammaproteobacteria bacterium]
MKKNLDDTFWMQQALQRAELALQHNEVPVGAIVVYEDKIIGEGWDQTVSEKDPTAHAEIIALRAAGKTLQNYRLLDATLYVTLEPCSMCAGALVNARLKRVVFALADNKSGACGSVFNIIDAACLNHRLYSTQGILAEESLALLQSFFKARR